MAHWMCPSYFQAVLLIPYHICICFESLLAQFMQFWQAFPSEGASSCRQRGSYDLQVLQAEVLYLMRTV